MLKQKNSTSSCGLSVSWEKVVWTSPVILILFSSLTCCTRFVILNPVQSFLSYFSVLLNPLFNLPNASQITHGSYFFRWMEDQIFPTIFCMAELMDKLLSIFTIWGFLGVCRFNCTECCDPESCSYQNLIDFRAGKSLFFRLVFYHSFWSMMNYSQDVVWIRQKSMTHFSYFSWGLFFAFFRFLVGFL